MGVGKREKRLRGNIGQRYKKNLFYFDLNVETLSGKDPLYKKYNPKD